MSSRSKASKAKLEKRGLGRGEIVGIVIVVIIAIWAAYSFSQPSQPTITTTQTSLTTSQPFGAPDFTLPVVGPNGLTGEKVSLSSFRGKVVLLEFMVPWCGHCQNMAPVLERLYQQYGPQNVVFLSVSGSWQGPDGRFANADDAAKFIQTYHSTWIYVYDASNTAFNLYGVKSTPNFFILSKDGSVSTRYEGEVAYETLAADLTRLSI